MSETRSDGCFLNEIKSCPFCGGLGWMDSCSEGDGLEFYVHCASCHCEGPWARYMENAITLWNTRRSV